MPIFCNIIQSNSVVHFLDSSQQILECFMSKELSGFKKSAPANYPNTRDQASTTNSAWDIDLSPFHRIIDEQNSTNRQMMEMLAKKWEELLDKVQSLFISVKDNEIQREIQRSQQHEQTLQQQGQSNQEIVRTLEHLCTEIVEFRQTLAHWNVGTFSAESEQKSLMIEQANEVQTSSFHQLQQLTMIGQEIRNLLQESHSIRYQTNEHFCKMMSQIPTEYQMNEHFNHLMQHEDQLLAQIIGLCEKITIGLEHFGGNTKSLERMCETWEGFIEEQKRVQKHNTRLFWIFIGSAIILFLWFMFTL